MSTHSCAHIWIWGVPTSCNTSITWIFLWLLSVYAIYGFQCSENSCGCLHHLTLIIWFKCSNVHRGTCTQHIHLINLLVMISVSKKEVIRWNYSGFLHCVGWDTCSNVLEEQMCHFTYHLHNIHKENIKTYVKKIPSVEVMSMCLSVTQ
jgi:hypothetical protein